MINKKDLERHVNRMLAADEEYPGFCQDIHYLVEAFFKAQSYNAGEHLLEAAAEVEKTQQYGTALTGFLTKPKGN